MPDDDLNIPDFLRRLSQRLDTPLPPSPTKPQLVMPTAAAKPVAPEVVIRKRAKASKRIGRMKQNLERDNIPDAFREWDSRLSRWVDSRLVQHERLKAAADRLGVTLENTEMDKLTIVPYHIGATLPAERGRATLAATAADFEIQAKVIKSANRAGLSRVERVEVVNPNGEVQETWTLDSATKMLHKVGTEVKVTALVEKEKEKESTMPTKRKAKKANSKNGGGVKSPGVIATIIETIKRDRGASKDEILAVLAKRFPDRKAKSMASTVNIQATKNAKKKDKDDKRGLVYYG